MLQLRYMGVICVIWYKIFTVFQNYWGGLGPPLAPPSVRHCRATESSCRAQTTSSSIAGAGVLYHMHESAARVFYS